MFHGFSNPVFVLCRNDVNSGLLTVVVMTGHRQYAAGCVRLVLSGYSRSHLAFWDLRNPVSTAVCSDRCRYWLAPLHPYYTCI